VRAFKFGFLLLALGARLAAWQDPFQQWKASGYAQVWALGRPETGLPRAGALDDSGHEASGWRLDGLFVRNLELKLAGPLGWDGWSARLSSSTDLQQYGVADAAVEWAPLDSLKLQAGQMRLPFGQELQLSSASLPAFQRSLILGYPNYGHVNGWGLGLLNERGLGLRADWSPWANAPLRPVLQAGAFMAKGQGWYRLNGGGGRGALRWELGALGGEAGASLFVAHGQFAWQAASYQPLGVDPMPSSAWTKVEDLGRGTVLTWGEDAALALGPLHAQAEFAWQSAADRMRGGGEGTLWMELPVGMGTRVYVRREGASSGWGDGVHRVDGWYRSEAYGVHLGLPAGQSLDFARTEFGGDDVATGFPGQLWLAQWQLDF
jgi:hypothetical protein